jgi:cytochrome c oxidase subunit 1/cytochrome c oxidase subunit I+III
MSETAPAVEVMEAEPAENEAHGLFGWVATVDHKRIGILYLLTALFFFFVGGAEALLLRVQLIRPNNTFLSPDAFNELFTMHGTTMIFLVVMPTLIGLANYFAPLMIGARDMAFPRLNAMSYWLLPFGGLLLHFSLVDGGPPAVGWFSYAPLSETPYASQPGVDYWVLALLILGTGSIAAAINLIATILTLRAPGLTLRRLPLFVWMMFITSILIVLAMPALNAAIVMLIIDRQLSAQFFLPSHGGSALLWQHFFWAFGHPEVYILALPAFGIISEVIPVFSRRPIFGYEFVAASTVAIGLLSFGVWAHHMFAVGMGHPVDLFFAAASMLIAVPTGVKIFNWSATMWGGSIRLTTSMLFAVAFLIQFTVGGLSGVTFAVAPIDWQVTDTYYLVAHLHYVLFGGSMFGIFAGLYYWFPKMTGRMLSERLGKWNFWLAVIGFNGAFFVQHFLGLMGMPRRVYTYPDVRGWALLNLISSVGAFVLGLSVLVFVWNMVVSLRRGKLAGDNPWRAWTLEWATTSPPPEYNFERVPPVNSRRPLWDLANPQKQDPPDGAPAKGREVNLDKNHVSMTCFIISEGMFFLMLIIAYIFFNTSQPAGPTAGSALNRMKTAIYTIFLLSSSFTFWRAEKNLEQHRPRAFQAWLFATVLLGAVFIVGQGREYLHLFQQGVTINTNLFSSSFFTLTGFHGLHVCVGLVALLIMLGLARAGDFTTGRVEAVKSIGMYWHFVDAVWIVVFTVVYLIGPKL